MSTLLTFLQGKKWTIASLIGILNLWLFAKNYIDLVTATAIGWVATVLFGVASYQTGKLPPLPINLTQ